MYDQTQLVKFAQDCKSRNIDSEIYEGGTPLALLPPLPTGSPLALPLTPLPTLEGGKEGGRVEGRVGGGEGGRVGGRVGGGRQGVKESQAPDMR